MVCAVVYLMAYVALALSLSVRIWLVDLTVIVKLL